MWCRVAESTKVEFLVWPIKPKIAERHPWVRRVAGAENKSHYCTLTCCYKVYIALATLCNWKMQVLTFRLKFHNCVRSYCSLRSKFGDTSLWMTLYSLRVAPFCRSVRWAHLTVYSTPARIHVVDARRHFRLLISCNEYMTCFKNISHIVHV